MSIYRNLVKKIIKDESAGARSRICTYERAHLCSHVSNATAYRIITPKSKPQFIRRYYNIIAHTEYYIFLRITFSVYFFSLLFRSPFPLPLPSSSRSTLHVTCILYVYITSGLISTRSVFWITTRKTVRFSVHDAHYASVCVARVIHTHVFGWFFFFMILFCYHYYLIYFGRFQLVITCRRTALLLYVPFSSYIP